MAVLTIDEINIGDEYSKTVLFDHERVVEFINFTQDTASIHIDKNFSNEKGFENLVVHGFGLSTIFSRILGLAARRGPQADSLGQLQLIRFDLDRSRRALGSSRALPR